MAQTHQLLNFEPWLKPPKNGPLSHGSNPHLTCRFSHEYFLINLNSKNLISFLQRKLVCIFELLSICLNTELKLFYVACNKVLPSWISVEETR